MTRPYNTALPPRMFLITILIAFGACSAPASSPLASTADSPSAVPSQAAAATPLPDPTLPDAADVSTYRGEPWRIGAMPGPGPDGTPSVVWRLDAGSPVAATILAHDGVAFVIAEDGVVHTMDLGTGETRWTLDTGQRIHASPVIVGELLIVGDSMGRVTALDTKDGAEAWTASVLGSISGSPAPVGDTVVFATELGRAIALNAATGETIWQTELGAGVSRSVSATADAVYLGLSGGTLLVLDATDGAEIWRRELDTPGEISTPAVADSLVAFATGLDVDDPSARSVTALDIGTGETRWTYTSPTHAGLYSPALVDGVAYIVGHDRLVVALDDTNGHVLWSTELGNEVEALPSVVDGVLYTAANDHGAVALNAATGEVLWEVPIRGVPWAPTVTGGFMLIGTDGGTVYGIGTP